VTANPPLPPASPRVASIDALRGFDMFWIIGGQEVVLAILKLFVSPTPPWLKVQMDHTQWEGFSAYDLIMPLFLFIVGAAMPYSFARRIEAGASKAALYRKVLLRTLILFVLGMAAQGHLLAADLSQLHIYSNTLQAIACGYLIASIAMFHLRVWGQVLLAIFLLAGYWLLMVLVPVPGYGAGLWQEHTNLAMYIDDAILGRFQDRTIYTWLLSGMAFGATVLLGVFSGHLLRSAMAPGKKVVALLALGLACLGLGWAWSQEPWLGSWRCPIIKHLFTSSMVLWACGWSYVLLAVFYLVIDVLGFRRWSFFFIVIGSNAILAYLLTHLPVGFGRIANDFVGGIARNLTAAHSPLLQALGEGLPHWTAFAIVWLILLYLYRKGTFVRV
jgi:predicted acyltransferase